MSSKYVDPVYSFSVDLPENWVIHAIKGSPDSQNIRLTASLNNEAEIRISCAPPGSQTPLNKISRAYFYKMDLEQTSRNKISDALHDIVTPISGKDNSVRLELLTQMGFKGIISIIHAGIEYLIKYESNNSKRDLVESLINSFILLGYRPATERNSKRYDQQIKMIDSENEAIRKLTREILIKSGSEGVTALISSINACNQEIMIALQTRGIAENEILALRRRIEIIGEIRNIRGVGPIINAIGDSVQSQIYSRESAKLLLASKEALIKIGNIAVNQIRQIIDLAGPLVRKVLVDVLIEIGTPNAINVIRPMLTYPDQSIRELVERAIRVVPFNIIKTEAKL